MRSGRVASVKFGQVECWIWVGNKLYWGGRSWGIGPRVLDLGSRRVLDLGGEGSWENDSPSLGHVDTVASPRLSPGIRARDSGA